jgi:hypothetical protein
MFGEARHACANKGNLSWGVPPELKLSPPCPLVPQGELRRMGAYEYLVPVKPSLSVKPPLFLLALEARQALS